MWKKRGVIFRREGGRFFKSHTTRPIPILIEKGRLRIFFFSRCAEDTMHPTYIDVNPANPSEIYSVCEDSLMSLGDPGTFDDSGISPGCIVDQGDKKFVYYTGWKRRRVVNFEFSVGMAELEDNSSRMRRLFRGPVLGQDRYHPILAGGPFVLRDEERFKMWYCSGSRWISAEHGMEPIYNVHYAESSNGMDWRWIRGPILEESFEGEVITAPWVTKRKQGWEMWYSYRGSINRESKNYKIGLAVSSDGVNWERKDEDAGLALSETGWDSEMVCYPAIYEFDGKRIMLYCGNQVGRGGIGWAISDEEL